MFISEIAQQYNQNIDLFNRSYFEEHLTRLHTGGRIISTRQQRTLFITIGWGQHTIQIMCESSNPHNEVLRTLHVGDIIEVAGTLTRTLRGELSIVPEQVQVNSQTDHNIELRRSFENNHEILREVNLMRNPELFNNIHTRSLIVQRIRQHMYAQQFLEMETPILHENPSGASSRTFETDCFANNNHYHLRIAPEIYLVRTIMSGFNQIFEIGHNFRNEGISNRHQPEFSMLECYRAFSDHIWAMDFVQNLLHTLGEEFNCEILTEPFETLTYQEALVRYHPQLNEYNSHLIVDRDWLISQLPNNLNYENTSVEMLQFSVFETIDHLILAPTFITHHPIEISPLAQSIDDTRHTQRFELFVNGRELGNGFSQLIDSQEQACRFEMQNNNQESERMLTDHIYMQSMSYGFPRIGGFGIGIDRLVMLLTQQNDIRNVVLFPT